jgi:hypothetical protein
MGELEGVTTRVYSASADPVRLSGCGSLIKNRRKIND